MTAWSHHPIDERPERIAAAEAAARWGFHRLIDPAEVLCGDWFRMGHRVVWWFEAPLVSLPGVRSLHVAVSPAYRRRWPVRRWMFHVEAEALRLGASSVVAVVDASGDVDAYLRRLGWSREGPACVLRLGG